MELSTHRGLRALLGCAAGLATGIGVGAIFSAFIREPSALASGLLAVHIVALPVATWAVVFSWCESGTGLGFSDPVYSVAILGSPAAMFVSKIIVYHAMFPGSWAGYYSRYFLWSTACLLAIEGTFIGYWSPVVAQRRQAAARASRKRAELERALRQAEGDIVICSRKLEEARRFREQTRAVEARIAHLVSSDPANLELAARRLTDTAQRISAREIGGRLSQVREDAEARARLLEGMERQVEDARGAHRRDLEDQSRAEAQVRRLAEADPANVGLVIKRMSSLEALGDEELKRCQVANDIQSAYRELLLAERSALRSRQAQEVAETRARQAAGEVKLLELELVILEREQARRAANLDFDPSIVTLQLQEVEARKAKLLSSLASAGAAAARTRGKVQR